MHNIFLKFIKELSKYEINISNNYQLIRKIQNKTPLYKKSNIVKDNNYNYHIFKPKNIKTTNTIIYLHGGGWTTGNVKFYSFMLNKLANNLNRNIITFNYPLAPEYPFPEGLNYCYAAIKNLLKKANKYNININNVIIMGDSAGANLATAISIKAKKEKIFKIKKQILLYPIVQTNFLNNKKFKSIEKNGYNYYLTKNMIIDYLHLYTNNPKNYNNKYINILKNKWLFNMPETLIITADLDPLKDEGYYYAKKLKFYFNKVTYYNIKGVIHGFFNNILYYKENHYVTKLIKKFIGDKND